MCMIEGAEDGPVTMLHERHRVARKEHKCTECRRVIRRGESYLVERYVFDGGMSTVKTCAHCQVARAWLQKECGGWIFEAVEEDIREHVQEEDYGGAVRLLMVGMERQWTRKDGRLWRVPSVPKSAPQPDHQSVPDDGGILF